MKVEEKVQILKFLLIVFNGIFVILGLAVFGFGIWVLFDNSSLVALISGGNSVKVIAGSLFVVGLVVVGVSILGWVAAATEVSICVIMHIVFLLPIFVGELFITCMVIINRDTISGALVTEIDTIITVYGNNSSTDLRAVECQLLDLLQQYKGCCGRTNYTQWVMSNAYILSLHRTNVYPCSCFNTTLYSCPVLNGSSTQIFGQGAAVYQTGCQKSVEDWLLENGLAILLTNVLLCLIEAFQLALGVSFCCLTANKERKIQPERGASSVNYSAYHNVE